MVIFIYNLLHILYFKVIFGFFFFPPSIRTNFVKFLICFEFGIVDTLVTEIK